MGKFQRAKDILLGAVVAATIMGTATTAVAKVSNVNIPVSYKNIKVVVDGKTLSTDKEPFIYDGTTYLPVRAVAEAVGKSVGWDGNTNTVTLGSVATNNALPVEKYSRNLPAPIGTSQTITTDSYLGDSKVTITVLDAVRGDSAWRKIKDANMFNDKAPEGKEYVLAKVSANVEWVEDDKSIDLSSYSFTAFSAENVEYKSAFVVNPEPEFRGSVYAGGKLEGYVAFLVDETDALPKIVYGKGYDGSGGIWFSLTK